MRRTGAAVICVVALLFSAPIGPAAACSDSLSTLVAAALRPALQREKICRHLQHRLKTPFGSVTLGVERTERFELRGLQYCPSEPASRLTATVYVKCKTSADALVDFSFDETIDITMSVANRTCEITDFKVTPRGEIGRLVARQAGLSRRIRGAAAKHIHTLCR